MKETLGLTRYNILGQSFMTSPIGDLPIDSDGMRKAVDEIARLQKIIKDTATSKPIEMNSPIGVLTADAAGLKTAIDEIARCHAEIAELLAKLENNK